MGALGFQHFCLGFKSVLGMMCVCGLWDLGFKSSSCVLFKPNFGLFGSAYGGFSKEEVRRSKG